VPQRCRASISRPSNRRPRDHAAIVTADIAGSLRAGLKTIESRFSHSRRPPFGRVAPGDVIHFKLAGGPVFATARAAAVWQFEGLTPATVRGLRRRYGPAVCAAPAYWRRRLTARYAVLIWLSHLSPGRRRRPIPRQYGSGWVLLPHRRSLKLEI
jgi:hypothetical protein